MKLDAEACYAALKARDRRFDGRFFVGVTSTGIYCRPICPARTPTRAHCTFHESPVVAEGAGYRACMRCRPELAPGSGAAVDAVPALVRRATARIEAGYLNERSVDELASELGVSARHLRRAFEASVGAGPLAMAQTRRLAMARQLLRDGALPVIEVAHASGFASLRRFNAALREGLGKTPTELRKKRDGEAGEGGETFALALPYRAPFAWNALLRYLEKHAIPGVERVRDGAYERTARLGKAAGWLTLRDDAEAGCVRLRASVALAPSAMELVARARGMADLDADVGAIDAHLRTDPLLRASVEKRPGLRLPGGFDGFEVAARTVLGQQVSMSAANTLCGRVAARFGEGFEGAGAGLSRVFPTARVVGEGTVDALCALGIVRARAEALYAIAGKMRDGELRLSAGDDPGEAVRVLMGVKGIGPWSAEYIVLRALRESDAFPPADLALRRALGVKGLREERERVAGWSPFRAYGAVHLWTAYSEGER